MLLCIVSIVVGAQKSNVVEAISEFAIIIESLPLGNVQILFMYTPCAIEGGNIQFLHNYNKHVLLLLWSSHHVWEMWKEEQSILTYVKQECVHEADAISRGDNIFRFFSYSLLLACHCCVFVNGLTFRQTNSGNATIQGRVWPKINGPNMQ